MSSATNHIRSLLGKQIITTKSTSTSAAAVLTQSVRTCSSNSNNKTLLDEDIVASKRAVLSEASQEAQPILEQTGGLDSSTFVEHKDETILGHWHIGSDISVPIVEGSQPQLVPPSPHMNDIMPEQELLTMMRWMAQKDILGQDMCLWGDPGPHRRWLARAYCHFAKREAQFLSLSRDTTEADLKQRKELIGGKLHYSNRAAVTAALRGQILILEGLERAERNVLPVINNLLENREMSLDNGMLLVHPKRYDEIAAERGQRDLSDLGLIRVHERFRVIALALPTPKYPGHPIDPPLRSRFQCLYVPPAEATSAWETLVTAYRSSSSSETDTAVPKQILKVYEGLKNAEEHGHDQDSAHLKLPVPGIYEMRNWCVAQRTFPNVPPELLLKRTYPFELYSLILARSKTDVNDRMENAIRVLERAGVHNIAQSVHFYQDHTSGSSSRRRRSSSGSFAVYNLAELQSQSSSSATLIHSIEKKTPTSCEMTFGDGTRIEARCGNADKIPVDTTQVPSSNVLFARPHWEALSAMLQSHALGRHILLCAPAGSGKTVLIREFARMLGYQYFAQHLYSDMTSRDLFQRRSMDRDTGDSTWELNSLMVAAVDGGIAVLDGVDQLQPGVLSTLQSLLVDGNVTLADGTHYCNVEQFEELRRNLGGLSIARMAARGVFCIHPSFRVVATARPAVGGSASTSASKQPFLTLDVPSMFDVHYTPNLSSPDLTESLLRELGQRRIESSPVKVPSFGDPAVIANVLVNAQDELLELSKSESKVSPLTLRQLVRVMLHVVLFPVDASASLRGALLVPLLPPTVASRVTSIIDGACAPISSSKISSAGNKFSQLSASISKAFGSGGMSAAEQEKATAAANKEGLNLIPLTGEDEGSRAIVVSGVTLNILRPNRLKEEEHALVPHCLNFVPNQMHMRVAGWLVKQLTIGNHILLVGTQGVGKNKIVDFYLSETESPRHYVQLHRDTTVSSLTVNPVVEGGRVRWEDSPLVKAATRGHILVIDEVDKAPVEVVQILRGLIEDRELLLADGRRICQHCDEEAVQNGQQIALHPDFRLIVLANPPGYPFHGNDFYRECGDLFACLVLQQPDALSQDHLLERTAPNVPKAIRQQLIHLFADLAKEVENGTLQYPFSLREMLAAARHLQAFPQDGIIVALNNIFNFDACDEPTMETVRRLVHKNIRRTGRNTIKSLNLSAPQRLERDDGVLVVDLDLAAAKHGVAIQQRADAKICASNIGSSFPSFSINLTPNYFSYNANRLRLNLSDFSSFTETRGILEVADLLEQIGADKILGIVQLPNGATTMLVSRPKENTNENSAPFALLSVQSPAATTHEQNICPLVKEKACLLELPFLNINDSGNNNSPQLLRLDLSANDVCLLDVQNGTSLVVSPFSGRATQVRFAAANTIDCIDVSYAAYDGCIAFTTKDAPGSVNLLGRGGKIKTIKVTDKNQEITSIRNLGFGSWSVSCSVGTQHENHYWMNLVNDELTKLKAMSSNTANTLPEDLSSAHTSTLANSLFTTATQASIIPLARGSVSKLSLFASSSVTQDQLLAFPSNAAYASLDSNQQQQDNEAPNEHTSEKRLRESLFLHGKIENKNSIVFDAFRAPSDQQKHLGRAFSFDRDGKQLAFAYQDEASMGVVNFEQSTFRKITPTFSSSKTSSFMQKIKGSPLAASKLRGNFITHSPQFASMIAATSSSSNNLEQQHALAVVDLNPDRLMSEHAAWVAVSEGSSTFSGSRIGSEGANKLGKAPSTQELKQWYSSPVSKPRVDTTGDRDLKEGDYDGQQHVGGNQWKGGSGGTDTAGLGGVVGPYRFDGGHEIHQVPDELKKNVPKHVIEQAKAMGKAELQKRLNDIGMSGEENDQYVSAYMKVSPCISQIQNLLARLKAREGERVWLRHQSDGTWDDTKLVEGITGDSNIFRRRVDSTNDPALVAKHKKRILFCVDCSASMYRFNGADGRLTRMVETLIMVMEAFGGADSTISSKIEYAVVGHNGDEDHIPIIDWAEPPKNKKERLKVCMKIIAYAQYCWSGDNTVNAMERSIKTVTAQPGDDYFVFVISDANLAQYGITDTQLSRIIRSDERVKMYCLFIASIGSQAQNLSRRLPAGHGFEIRDTRQLPVILQNIFTATDLLS